MKLKFNIVFDTEALKLDIYPVKPVVVLTTGDDEEKQQKKKTIEEWQALTDKLQIEKKVPRPFSL